MLKHETKKQNHTVKTALELAGLEAEIEKPAIKLTKKRKLADTIALLQHEKDNSEEESDEEDELDWRRKKYEKGEWLIGSITDLTAVLCH